MSGYTATVDRPLVSVVMPTHNRRMLLERAIRSVLGQSCSEFELIIVDDGSTDGTEATAAAVVDSRLRYLHQDHGGPASARNAGIRLARGEWVAFLDDDDTWRPETLAQQLATARRWPATGMVIGGWAYVNAGGVLLSQARPWLAKPRLDLNVWLFACPAVPSAVMVRRAWLLQAGGFDESFARAQAGCDDWDLWLRLAYLGCPMAWTEEVVCDILAHPGSRSRDAHSQRRGALMVLDRFFAAPDLPRALRDQQGRAYSRAFLRTAARLYGAGLSAEACDDVAAAIAHDPELLADDGALLVKWLVGVVGTPAVGDPLAYVSTIFDHLPADAAHLAHQRKRALARAAQSALFHAHDRGDRRGVLRNLRVILANDVQALRDVGIWSATAQALLGRAAISGLRRILRRNDGPRD